MNLQPLLLRLLHALPIRAEPMLQSSAEDPFMPYVDVSSLPVRERLPGWRGRYFHSEHMTFAHYEFQKGASIHEHYHPEEEVYEVLEGELELTIEGVPQLAKPGMVAIVPSNARHSVKALSDGRLIVIDHPRRADFQ
jgi:quercetin dioxygenase-like cupin family protein